jgi:hypothetical protein
VTDQGQPDETADRTPLEVLNAAVTAFANELADQPVLVDVAVVLWEQVSYDEDGDVGRRIRYAVPTDNFSLSSGLGLIEAGGEYVRRDILGARREDDL